MNFLEEANDPKIKNIFFREKSTWIQKLKIYYFFCLRALIKINLSIEKEINLSIEKGFHHAITIILFYKYKKNIQTIK